MEQCHFIVLLGKELSNKLLNEILMKNKQFLLDRRKYLQF